MPGAGRCINCSDKPKFGGAGIRKQSCIFRRCERPQSDWDEKPELQSPKAQPLSAVPDPSAAQLPPATTTVTEEESLFWGAVQVLQGSGPRQQQCAPCAPSLCGLQSKLKGNRCGECAACNRDDCGSCLNCRDKPRFGGRGARKQACVMRTCATPWMGSGASEPDEAEELSDSTSSDETASPSADSPLGLQPSQPAALPPPLPPSAFRGGEQADAAGPVNGAPARGGARGHPAQPAFPQVPMMPPWGLSPPPMQCYGPHVPLMMPVAPAGQPAHLSSLLAPPLKSTPPLKSAPPHATKPHASVKLSHPTSPAATARRPACAAAPAAAPRVGGSAAGGLGGYTFGVEWLRKYEAFFGKDAMLREAQMLGGIGALPRDAMLHERQPVVVAAAVRVERQS